MGDSITEHSTEPRDPAKGLSVRFVQPFVMSTRSYVSWVSFRVINGTVRRFEWAGWVESDVLKRLAAPGPWLR